MKANSRNRKKADAKLRRFLICKESDIENGPWAIPICPEVAIATSAGSLKNWSKPVEVIESARSARAVRRSQEVKRRFGAADATSFDLTQHQICQRSLARSEVSRLHSAFPLSSYCQNRERIPVERLYLNRRTTVV